MRTLPALVVALFAFGATQTTYAQTTQGQTQSQGQTQGQGQGQGPQSQGPQGQGPQGQGPAGQGPAGQGPAGQGPAGQGPAGGQSQSQGQQDPNAPVRVLTQRPYRGMFGGGVGDTEQLLTLGANVGGGYDTSALTGTTTTGATTARVQRTQSGFAQGSANLDYSLNRRSIGFSASGGAAASYYPVVKRQPVATRYYVNAGGSYQVSQRAGLSGSFGMAFRPLQHLTVLPGPVVVDPALGPGNPFDNTLGGQYESYRNDSADVSVSYELTRRVNLSSGYGYWRSRSQLADYNYGTHEAHARSTVRVARNVGLYVGYRLGWSNPGLTTALPSWTTQNIDFGLAFNKALSLTRKTSLSFGTGTSGVTDGHRSTFSLTGNVHLAHELGRTWHATAAYRRDAQFDHTFQQPVFSDALWADVGGLVSRRVRFDAGGGTSFGRVGFSGAANGYRTYFLTSGLGMAISRNLSGGARYTFSRYWFDSNVPIPTALLYQTNRHGVSVYLSTWLELFSRSRRP